MSLREEWSIRMEDSTYCSVHSSIMEHPIIVQGWDRCLKTGVMPVDGFSLEQIQELRDLYLVLADKCEDLNCLLSAEYFRGKSKDEREMNLPRSRWYNKFMNP